MAAPRTAEQRSMPASTLTKAQYATANVRPTDYTGVVCSATASPGCLSGTGKFEVEAATPPAVRRCPDCTGVTLAPYTEKRGQFSELPLFHLRVDACVRAWPVTESLTSPVLTKATPPDTAREHR